MSAPRIADDDDRAREGVPRASVIMPAYNAETTIAAAVRSVVRQTEASFELIVVDDGSTDGTADVVSAMGDDPRIRLIAGDHRGAAAARNAGLQAARAPLVSFVDSDDLLLPRYLELMTAALEADPATGFVHTDAYMLDSRTGRVRRAVAMHGERPVPMPRTVEELHLALLRTNFIYNAVTARRGLFDELGGFDETLGAGIDYEMWLRIASHGLGAVHVPAALAVYRWGRAGSISSNLERVLTNLARVYEIAAEQHPGSPEAKELARRRRAAVEAQLVGLRETRRTRALWLRGRSVMAGLPRLGHSGRTWYPRNALPIELAEEFPELADAERWATPSGKSGQ